MVTNKPNSTLSRHFLVTVFITAISLFLAVSQIRAANFLNDDNITKVRLVIRPAQPIPTNESYPLPTSFQPKIFFAPSSFVEQLGLKIRSLFDHY